MLFSWTRWSLTLWRCCQRVIWLRSRPSGRRSKVSLRGMSDTRLWKGRPSGKSGSTSMSSCWLARLGWRRVHMGWRRILPSIDFTMYMQTHTLIHTTLYNPPPPPSPPTHTHTHTYSRWTQTKNVRSGSRQASRSVRERWRWVGRLRRKSGTVREINSGRVKPHNTSRPSWLTW